MSVFEAQRTSPLSGMKEAVVLHLCQSEAQAELTARFFSCKP